mmetsp:Transcript_50039/g.154609  ORF Transcript_50039/g.154609 Transcript_50039/m.154609 type:complete len:298 (-) Transcript_50039:356-1249(-)
MARCTLVCSEPCDSSAISPISFSCGTRSASCCRAIGCSLTLHTVLTAFASTSRSPSDANSSFSFGTTSALIACSFPSSLIVRATSAPVAAVRTTGSGWAARGMTLSTVRSCTAARFPARKKATLLTTSAASTSAVGSSRVASTLVIGRSARLSLTTMNASFTSKTRPSAASAIAHTSSSGDEILSTYFGTAPSAMRRSVAAPSLTAMWHAWQRRRPSATTAGLSSSSTLRNASKCCPAKATSCPRGVLITACSAMHASPRTSSSSSFSDATIVAIDPPWSEFTAWSAFCAKSSKSIE